MKTKYLHQAILILACALPKVAMAQCPSSFQAPTGPACVQACTTGTCPGFLEIRTQACDANVIDPDWVLTAGLENAGTGSTVVQGGTEYWIRVRSAVANLCPGKVTFRYRRTDEDCGNEYLVQNQISLVVSKTFNRSTHLNFMAANDPAIYPSGVPNPIPSNAFRVYTESPPCIQPGDLVTLSLRPYHQCLSNPANPVSEEFGFDEVVWQVPTGWTKVYEAHDQSSVTLKASSNLSGSTNISVRLGRCNSGWTLTAASFNISPSGLAIEVVDQGGLDNGFENGTVDENGVPDQAGLACLAAGSTSPFTLRAVPYENNNAGTLQWELPQGYSGTTSGNQIVITPQAGSNASSGLIRAYINNGQCRATYAGFQLNRRLDGTTTISTVRTNPETGNPIAADNANFPNQCFYPDLDYAFTLNNRPLNTALTWEIPTGSPSWINTSGQGTGTFSGNPTALPISGNPPLLGLTVFGPCGSSVNLPADRYKATALNFTIDDPQPGNSDLLISRNGLLLEVTNSANSGNWFYSCGATTLNAAQFFYQWRYEGEFTADQSLPQGSGVYVGSNSSDNRISGTNLNNLDLNPGTYNGTLVCRIRKTTSISACNAPELRCFYVELRLPISGTFMLPPGGGNPHWRAAGNEQSQNNQATGLNR